MAAPDAPDVTDRLETITDTLMMLSAAVRKMHDALTALRSLILTIAIVGFALYLRNRK